MRSIVTIMILFMIFSANAQEIIPGWVFFNGKPGSQFDPKSYFSDRGYRKFQMNPKIDFSDLPVSMIYTHQIEEIGGKINYTNRWFNVALVYANKNQWNSIQQLPFVTSIDQEQGKYNVQLAEKLPNISSDLTLLAQCQLERMGADYFKSQKLTGKGILICVADVGFTDVDHHPAFDHLRKNNQIKKVHDFAGNHKDVYYGHTHGTSVLSNIAGKMGETWLGMAQDADFLLAKTENRQERFSEEKSWLSMAEWAYQEGADIISSSLGYTFQRYEPYMMDGKTTFITRAANFAATKGMLVISAAGNEAESKWKFIAAPGDADSVLTVGGIDPKTGVHASFSSYGPTATGSLKPNVCAYGITVGAKPHQKYTIVEGTSFATPLVAGFAACLWQQYRTLSNMEMKTKIEESSDLYPYFDYHHGFGVPRADFALGNSRKIKSDSFHIDTTYSSDSSYTYYTLKLDTVPDEYLKAYQQLTLSVDPLIDSTIQPDSILNIDVADSKETLADTISLTVQEKLSLTTMAEAPLVSQEEMSAQTDSIAAVEITAVDTAFAVTDEIFHYDQPISGSSSEYFDSKKLLKLLPAAYYIRWPKMIFYHIENEHGQLIEYATLIPVSKEPYSWNSKTKGSKNILRVFYQGKIIEIKP